MKLNLGCGDKKRDGYVNVDVCGNPDQRYDLSIFPWPWPDGSADEVYSEHFLEHVQDYERTVLEIHRVLKAGGLLWFRVPHHRAPMATWHLHRWSFSTYTPILLCTEVPYQWGGRKLFEQIELKLNYPYTPAGLRQVITWLANLSPYRWDWLGLPVEEIEFRARKC